MEQSYLILKGQVNVFQILKAYISRRGAGLGHMLQLNTNSYMES